ncbi:MAG TPA: hypothetical protein PLD25_14530 [Chloroflexota bacterium]|nr:hypothetical protein [Chloroflexota bacterium]
MIEQEALQLKTKPWIVGCLLSAAAIGVGFFLGWTVLTVTTNNFAREPVMWDRVIEGFFRGVIIAGLQWPIVRSVGVRPVPFLLASGIGLAIGYPIGQFIAEPWGLELPWVWAFAIYGLSLGISQWLILRSHVKSGWLWIPLSTISWMLTIVIWGNLMNSGMDFVAGLGLGSVMYGLVAGAGLVWLVESQLQHPI